MHQVLIMAHGILATCSVQDLVPWSGIEPGPLHWEHRISATGPPGDFLAYVLKGS